MPRGVYDRKNKKSDTGTQASSTGASKTKKTWKAKSKAASAGVTARHTPSSGGDQFSSFTALTNYLTAIGQVRSSQSVPNTKLDQEFEATIGNLRNLRETIFSVTTDDVIGQDNSNNARQTAPTAAAAPVPFNPPQYSGQVQQ